MRDDKAKPTPFFACKCASGCHELLQMPQCGPCCVAPQAEAPTPTLQEFWDAHSAWSQVTFGADTERGPIGPLRHLAKEVSETLAKPEDELEMADCFLLVCDAARRSGLTCEQLLSACWKKLEINKRRVWPKTTDMNAAVEHER